MQARTYVNASQDMSGMSGLAAKQMPPAGQHSSARQASPVDEKASKLKSFHSVSIADWHRGIQKACRTAFSRLELRAEASIRDNILKRIQAGIHCDEPGRTMPCFLVERYSKTATPPFQIQVIGSRILAQKALYAAFNQLSAQDMGTWQVNQKCLHNDDSWWCFEPSHLEQCERDHVGSRVKKNGIPAPAHAVYLTRVRRPNKVPRSARDVQRLKYSNLPDSSAQSSPSTSGASVEDTSPVAEPSKRPSPPPPVFERMTGGPVPLTSHDLLMQAVSMDMASCTASPHDDPASAVDDSPEAPQLRAAHQPTPPPPARRKSELGNATSTWAPMGMLATSPSSLLGVGSTQVSDVVSYCSRSVPRHHLPAPSRLLDNDGDHPLGPQGLGLAIDVLWDQGQD